MKPSTIVLIAITIISYYPLNAQSATTEKVTKTGMDCEITIDKRPNVALFSLDVSAPGVRDGMGREIGERIVAYLKGSDCYNLNFAPSHYIPKTAQAYISGNLKDFYTSEKAIGKPRLHFDLELRHAETQEVLARTTIDLRGKLYMGIGENKPFKAIFQEALEASREFIMTNKDLIPERKPEMSTLDSNKSPYEQAMEHDPGTIKRTESVWEQMKNHADKKRAESRDMFLNKQEYYNAPGEYKSLVETKGDEYLIYTVDGKKHETNKHMRSLELMLTTNHRSSNQVKLYLQDIKRSKSLTLAMRDPASLPTKRKFILGAKNGILNDGAEESFWINFKFFLGINDIVEAKYQVHDGAVKMSNIEEGHINILFYEPELRGVLDFEFDFVVRTSDQGVRKIKGRLRTRV